MARLSDCKCLDVVARSLIIEVLETRMREDKKVLEEAKASVEAGTAGRAEKSLVAVLPQLAGMFESALSEIVDTPPCR